MRARAARRRSRTARLSKVPVVIQHKLLIKRTATLVTNEPCRPRNRLPRRRPITRSRPSPRPDPARRGCPFGSLRPKRSRSAAVFFRRPSTGPGSRAVWGCWEASRHSGSSRRAVSGPPCRGAAPSGYVDSARAADLAPGLPQLETNHCDSDENQASLCGRSAVDLRADLLRSRASGLTH